MSFPLPPAPRRIAGLAELRAVHQAFQWLHLNEVQLRRWQLEFLAIPAPPFGEGPRAAWFRDRFQDLGLENVHIDAIGNALGELRGANEGPDPPLMLLSAHLDTVFPEGTDCTPREDGDRILGPGSCDNGAGLAGLLGLAAAMKWSGVEPACTILFAANVGEEGEGDLRGMRHLFGSGSEYFQRIGAALALEGSGTGSAVNRALGGRRLRVTVGGPGGHSWADAGRLNPIIALSEAIAKLGDLRLPQRPRTTLNVGTIRGGTSVNSIPEFATADFDLRSIAPIEIDRAELAVLRVLTNAVERYNQPLAPAPSPGGVKAVIPDLRLTLHAERIGDRPAAMLMPGSAIAQSLSAVDRHLGIGTELRIGSTDANLPLSLGIPALAVGAGGHGAGVHTLAEFYDPTGRELALRRVLLLALDACQIAAAPQSLDAAAD
ncbi:Acetylornithine deacetylase/Succinyl-diaminopimelate desuccinylase [Bryocella elongata]|uniref:Acetylornithine deacetylase/Succinyl-diaminopimelate desuccinylase n=1 Tax=Bryocella elongata TaxID=863522 RepID=A0A1H5U6L4_9BACT|nr:M20/M25/M40 family metallo-hydrolase [Bryocella elongata]SEF69971.1 Acetylornithine deacetylase/Succinyl-diaminopimelate desuccinylase [Bryocella elongata]